MPPKIRPNNNSPQPDVPVDDEVQGVISTTYVWDSTLGEWIPATSAAALSGDLIRLKNADGSVVINPATLEEQVALRDGQDALKAEVRDVKRALTDYEVRLDYDVRTDGNPVYVGKAPQGTATSATGWTLQKLDYDASARLLRVQVVNNAVWDDRAVSF